MQSGVPLGGIGCGTFQLMTDGAISRATINNNWNRPTDDLNGCFAAVWTSAGGRIDARALSLKSPYGLPGVAAVDYLGLFPQAYLQYPDARLPVSVSLRAYSPLVPQDLMSSTMPVALFVFSIKNEARAPVEAGIALSWENFIGVGGTASKGAFADRSGNTVTPIPQAEGVFGLRMAGPDRPASDPPTRFYYNAQGSYALMAQPTTPDTVVTTAGWNALDKTPDWWGKFAAGGTVQGSADKGREGTVHPAGVIALKVSLKAGETRDLPFAVAWYTPRLYTLDGSEYGHFYQKIFQDAAGVGRFALQNRLSLAALTDEWQNRFLRSSLPPWLAHRLINDASILFTNTIYTQDSGLAGKNQGPSLFAILEQPGNNRVSNAPGASDIPGALGAIDRRLFAHYMLASLFPAQNLRELEQFVAAQEPGGAIRRLVGNIDESIGGEKPGEAGAAREEQSVSSSSFAIQIGQYHAWSGDPQFLDRFYPAAKHAIEFSAGRAAQASSGAAPTPNGLALLRGALHAGEVMAGVMQDRRFAEQCRQWLASIKRPDNRDANTLEDWVVFSLGVLDANSAVPQTNNEDRTAQIGAEPGPRRIPLLAVEAATLAFRGDTNSALSLMRLADQLIVEQAGSPWAYPAELSPGELHAGGGGSLSMPASWNVLPALAGYDFNAATGRLTLTPQLPKGARVLNVPIFAPNFWATLEYRPAATRIHLQFRLDRTLPVASPYERAKKEKKGAAAAGAETSSGLIVKQVVLPAPPNPTMQLTASLGRAPLTGKSVSDGNGHVVFTPDAPVTLTTGLRLEFLFRP